MTDRQLADYALGHDPKRAVMIKHSAWTVDEPTRSAINVHHTGYDGLHYFFSIPRGEVLPIIRKLINLESMMSDTKRSA